MAFNVAPIRDLGRRLAAEYRFDAYTVVRTVNADDGEGGGTPTEGVVEAGSCNLTAGATRPEERAVADQAQSTAPYVLRNLPWNTILAASDTVQVAGRTFEVLGVLRTEAANVAVTAVVEERT